MIRIEVTSLLILKESILVFIRHLFYHYFFLVDTLQQETFFLLHEIPISLKILPAFIKEAHLFFKCLDLLTFDLLPFDVLLELCNLCIAGT